MIVDLNGVEVKDKVDWINTPGKKHLKVVEVDDTKVSKNNNPIIKIKFQNADGQFITNKVILTKKSLWRLKVITKALKMPNCIDTNLMIGRYVWGIVKAVPYTAIGGQVEYKYEIKEYEESKLTNTLEEEADCNAAHKFYEVVHDNNAEIPDMGIDDQDQVIPF